MALARQFPAVLILGPRQCGKTTLARHFLQGEYFDLERPSHRQVFDADAESALAGGGQPLILDEVQSVPTIFSVLRAVIDEDRSQTGRFFLLGSVNPALVRGVAESLAGRVGIVELTPFLWAEVASRSDLDFSRYWLRGGFPEACLEAEDSRRDLWQENFLRATLERDLAQRGGRLAPDALQRLMAMAAHVHGGLLDAAGLGRSLGCSYHTVNHHLSLLEGFFLVRRLLPYHANLGKRLVKSPKLYLRDAGLLHHLLGIRTPRNLLVSPQRGASFEGLMIEQLIAAEACARPSSRFYFFRTQAGAEVDLVVDRGDARIGYEFKATRAVTRGDWRNLRAAIKDDVIQAGRLVYLGDQRFGAGENLEALPAAGVGR